MPYLILFLFGLAIGSFVNVIALRYGGDHFLFNPKVIGGRSRCPHCKRTLRWFELIPLLSFVLQRGQCRHCGAKMGLHYPLVELLSGLVFVLVPLHFASYPWVADVSWYIFSGFWIAAFEILILIAYIDFRLEIIPDELVVLLGIVAIFETILAAAYLGPNQLSVFGEYASMLGPYGNSWLGHLIGAVFGAGSFGLLALLTRGKGMGMGDVKLGAPLGFLFGWPDIALLYGMAFVVGALVGVVLIIKNMKTPKSAVPFAPFLVVGAALTFFFGSPAITWYLHIIGI